MMYAVNYKTGHKVGCINRVYTKEFVAWNFVNAVLN